MKVFFLNNDGGGFASQIISLRAQRWRNCQPIAGAEVAIPRVRFRLILARIRRLRLPRAPIDRANSMDSNRRDRPKVVEKIVSARPRRQASGGDGQCDVGGNQLVQFGEVNLTFHPEISSAHALCVPRVLRIVDSAEHDDRKMGGFWFAADAL